jgi:integrase
MSSARVIKQSKSGKQRSIKINETLNDLLLTLPSKGVFEYVFTHERVHKKTGLVIGQGKIRETNHEWRRATKRAKLDHFRFHDLRHSFASHIVQANGGVSLQLKEQLGHSSISMTERYSHVADASKLETVRSLDKLKLTIPVAGASESDTKQTQSPFTAGMGLLQVF